MVHNKSCLVSDKLFKDLKALLVKRPTQVWSISLGYWNTTTCYAEKTTPNRCARRKILNQDHPPPPLPPKVHLRSILVVYRNYRPVCRNAIFRPKNAYVTSSKLDLSLIRCFKNVWLRIGSCVTARGTRLAWHQLSLMLLFYHVCPSENSKVKAKIIPCSTVTSGNGMWLRQAHNFGRRRLQEKTGAWFALLTVYMLSGRGLSALKGPPSCSRLWFECSFTHGVFC